MPTTLNENYLLPWGILGIDQFSSLRRTRTLGLGAVVRKFNDLAVPGMGNVRFAKQICLSLLGVAVAEKAIAKGYKVRNIELTNAIEALACLKAFQSNDWQSDSRLRGINKLRNVEGTFAKLRKAGVYVTQPLRMGTVQALPALGLVPNDSSLFNSFTLTQEGEVLINTISAEFKQVKNSVTDLLLKWIEKDNSECHSGINDILSPIMPLSKESRKILKEVLAHGGDEMTIQRRNAILKWVNNPDLAAKRNKRWDNISKDISMEHRRDLEAGALFFKTRDKAIELLNELEVYIEKQKSETINLLITTNVLQKHKQNVIDAANEFILFGYDPTENMEASRFCRECNVQSNLIMNLVKRDGVGLVLEGEKIVKGHAFKGSVNQRIMDDEEESINDDNLRQHFPDYISFRVFNMFYLNQDLNGTLNNWI